MIQKIYNKFILDIDYHLSKHDEDYKKSYHNPIIQNIFYNNDLQIGGCYKPDALYGTIYLQPNMNLWFQLVVILHEFGHHRLVCSFDDRDSLSKTGFRYGKSRRSQLFNLVKEEACAWLNAHIYLFKNNIKGISFYYKMLIMSYMTFSGLPFLFEYADYAIYEHFKMRLVPNE